MLDVYLPLNNHLGLALVFIQLLEHLLATLTLRLPFVILKVLQVARVLTIQFTLVFLLNLPQFTLFHIVPKNLDFRLVA